jgi:hypothetical protein
MGSLESLRPLGRLSVGEYRARLYERKAAERLLQEAIEAALDINAHLIAELGSEILRITTVASFGQANWASYRSISPALWRRRPGFETASSTSTTRSTTPECWKPSRRH